MQTNASLYLRVAFMLGKKEGHTLKSLAWVSSVSLKDEGGAPRESEMFVLPKNIPSISTHLSFKEFLFYYEKYTPPADANHSGCVPCPRAFPINLIYIFCRPSDKQPPRDWDPLVKQTYSVWVDTDKGRRKWHLSKDLLRLEFST